LRRCAGGSATKATTTELVFESLTTGSLVRSIFLAGGPDFVTGWDLDPSHSKVVLALRTAARTTTIELDLESGDRKEVPVVGEQPKWLPSAAT
jgi:hypothetical protein